MVNAGTEPSPPVMDEVRDRAARCPLKDSARGGASAVVGERESRLQGEGRGKMNSRVLENQDDPGEYQRFVDRGGAGP